MHRRAAALVPVVAAALAAAPAAGALTVTDANLLERAVVKRINVVRGNHGLRALPSRPRLKRAGTSHVWNMARNGYFAHDWADGTPYGRWIRRFWPGPGYRGWSAGENLYWEGPSTTARRVVTAWMGSPGHRRNILDGSWRFLGVGAVKAAHPVGVYARASTAYVVAVEFGARSQ